MPEPTAGATRDGYPWPAAEQPGPAADGVRISAGPWLTTGPEAPGQIRPYCPGRPGRLGRPGRDGHPHLY